MPVSVVVAMVITVEAVTDVMVVIGVWVSVVFAGVVDVEVQLGAKLIIMKRERVVTSSGIFTFL